MVVVMILAVLTLTGIIAVKTSNTEIRIAGNHFVGQAAFYAAEAGITEVIERLKGLNADADFLGDPGATPNGWWSAYLLTPHSWQPATDDAGYDGNYQNYIPTASDHTNTAVVDNSLQAAMAYMVSIRHKNEFDAEQAGHTVGTSHYCDGDGSNATHSAASPGSIIYYGYGDPAQPTTATAFTTPGATEASPIEIITAYGTRTNFQGQGYTKKIIVEAVRNPGPKIVSALYANGDVTGNGTALTVDGSDSCGAVPAKAPIYTKDPSITILNGTPILNGDPTTPQTGTDEVDIIAQIDDLKESATVNLTSDQSGVNYGDAAHFVTVYSNTAIPYNVNGLTLSNVTGYGILLVEGDLILGGGFTWNGLILTTGTLVFNGGGAGINIRGAVLANQTIDINGNIDTRYDSCMIDNALNNTRYQILSWREDY